MNVKSIYPPLFQLEVKPKNNIPEKPTVIISKDTFLVVEQFNPLIGKFIREGEDMKGLVCECEDIDHLLDTINIVLKSEQNQNLMELFKFI
jgi:hypothetical protein